jgi:hypothetical protein
VREATKITGARQRSLIIPREHGAWGILLVPLLTGALGGILSGGSGAGLIPLSLVALTLFCLRTPLESWAGASSIRARTPSEFKLVQTTAVLLALAAAGCLIWLFWGGRNRALLWIGGAAGAAFALQTLVKWRWRSAKTAAQIVGAAGLTATAPAGYYVATGHLNLLAWSLWAANFLFAVNQIQFVHLQIHAARATNRRQKLAIGRKFVLGQVFTLAFILMLGAAGAFCWYTAIAFFPVLVRGFGWFFAKPQPLAIHALGKSELVHACVFCLLLVTGLWIS